MTSSNDGTDADAEADVADDALVLLAHVRESLHERAASGAPEEVCGVLVGRRSRPEGDDGRMGGAGGRDADGSDADGTAPDDSRDRRDRVEEAIPVPNVADSPRTRYELDPAETLRVVEAAEADGDDVVGFYHSHPHGPVEPSATDREHATWTGYVYCIVSPDALAAYRWTGDDFRRLRVEAP